MPALQLTSDEFNAAAKVAVESGYSEWGNLRWEPTDGGVQVAYYFPDPDNVARTYDVPSEIVTAVTGFAADEKTALKAYAARLRRRRLDGLIVETPFGDTWTDRGTRGDIGDKIRMIDELNITDPVNFKLVGGSVSVTRANLVTIGAVIGNAVQGEFDKEASCEAAIDAETITTEAEIDAAFEG